MKNYTVKNGLVATSKNNNFKNRFHNSKNNYNKCQQKQKNKKKKEICFRKE